MTRQPTPLTDDELRRRRVASQLLHRPRRRSAADLVRHLGAVQAQVYGAAKLALRARSEGLTGAAVERARAGDRSIVRTWAHRGTLHLIAAEDYDWLMPIVTPTRVTGNMTRLRQLGVTGTQPLRAVQAIRRMLGRHGRLTRAEIAEGLTRARIRTEGQAMPHLLWLASAEGVICHGPGESFVLREDWLGSTRRRGGLPEDPLAELAVRYLRAHAPATPEDLAYWAGTRLGDARAGWRAIEDRIREVHTDRGPMWTLRSAPTARVPKGVVRLLPYFDEYLLGWKDRSFFVDPKRWDAMVRGGGWFPRVVIEDGLAVAEWRTEPGSAGVDVTGFAQLRAGVPAAATKEATYLLG